MRRTIFFSIVLASLGLWNPSQAEEAPDASPPKEVLAAAGALLREDCPSAQVIDKLEKAERQDHGLLLTCAKLPSWAKTAYNPEFNTIVIPEDLCRQPESLAREILYAGTQYLGVAGHRWTAQDLKMLEERPGRELEEFLTDSTRDACQNWEANQAPRNGAEGGPFGETSRRFSAKEALAKAAGMAKSLRRDESSDAAEEKPLDDRDRYLIYDGKGKLRTSVIGWKNAREILESHPRYRYRTDTRGMRFEKDPVISLPGDAPVMQDAPPNMSALMNGKVIGLYSEGRLVHVAESYRDFTEWMLGTSPAIRNKDPNHSYTWGDSRRFAQREASRKAKAEREPPDAPARNERDIERPGVETGTSGETSLNDQADSHPPKQTQTLGETEQKPKNVSGRLDKAKKKPEELSENGGAAAENVASVSLKRQPSKPPNSSPEIDLSGIKARLVSKLNVQTIADIYSERGVPLDAEAMQALSHGGNYSHFLLRTHNGHPAIYLLSNTSFVSVYYHRVEKTVRTVSVALKDLLLEGEESAAGDLLLHFILNRRPWVQNFGKEDAESLGFAQELIGRIQSASPSAGTPPNPAALRQDALLNKTLNDRGRAAIEKVFKDAGDTVPPEVLAKTAGPDPVIGRHATLAGGNPKVSILTKSGFSYLSANKNKSVQLEEFSLKDMKKAQVLPIGLHAWLSFKDAEGRPKVVMLGMVRDKTALDFGKRIIGAIGAAISAASAAVEERTKPRTPGPVPASSPEIDAIVEKTSAMRAEKRVPLKPGPEAGWAERLARRTASQLGPGSGEEFSAREKDRLKTRLAAAVHGEKILSSYLAFDPMQTGFFSSSSHPDGAATGYLLTQNRLIRLNVPFKSGAQAEIRETYDLSKSKPSVEAFEGSRMRFYFDPGDRSRFVQFDGSNAELLGFFNRVVQASSGPAGPPLPKEDPPLAAATPEINQIADKAYSLMTAGSKMPASRPASNWQEKLVNGAARLRALMYVGSPQIPPAVKDQIRGELSKAVRGENIVSSMLSLDPFQQKFNPSSPLSYPSGVVVGYVLTPSRLLRVNVSSDPGAKVEIRESYNLIHQKPSLEKSDDNRMRFYFDRVDRGRFIQFNGSNAELLGFFNRVVQASNDLAGSGSRDAAKKNVPSGTVSHENSADQVARFFESGGRTMDTAILGKIYQAGPSKMFGYNNPDGKNSTAWVLTKESFLVVRYADHKFTLESIPMKEARDALVLHSWSGDWGLRLLLDGKTLDFPMGPGKEGKAFAEDVLWAVSDASSHSSAPQKNNPPN